MVCINKYTVHIKKVTLTESERPGQRECNPNSGAFSVDKVVNFLFSVTALTASRSLFLLLFLPVFLVLTFRHRLIEFLLETVKQEEKNRTCQREKGNE